MLSRNELVELYRELDEETVLSVYIDAEEHDPAKRRTWRVRLDHGLTLCREALTERTDREQFEAAWARIENLVREFDAFVPDRGWVGFATAESLHYGESVPVPVPDGVIWERGLRVAPYVRVLKQQRPVVVALLDGRRSRVLRYREGAIESVATLRADTWVGDLSDVGVGKRSTRRSGVRGETSTDQARRVLEVSSERMLKEVVERVAEEAGTEGLAVLGGTPEMVSRAAVAMPRTLDARVLERPSLHMDMDDTEIVPAVEAAASELTRQLQDRLLSEVFDAARAGGRACAGRDATSRALREMRVDALLLSRRLILDEPDLADQCVGTAFSQGAATEELSGSAAERLDAEGEGIAARLRFTL